MRCKVLHFFCLPFVVAFVLTRFPSIEGCIRASFVCLNLLKFERAFLTDLAWRLIKFIARLTLFCCPLRLSSTCHKFFKSRTNLRSWRFFLPELSHLPRSNPLVALPLPRTLPQREKKKKTATQRYTVGI